MILQCEARQKAVESEGGSGASHEKKPAILQDFEIYFVLYLHASPYFAKIILNAAFAVLLYWALLLKQPTPRKGTKTRQPRHTFQHIRETTYTPQGDENFINLLFSKSQP